MFTMSLPAPMARLTRLVFVFCGVLALSLVPAVSAQPVPTDSPLDEPLGERVDFEISMTEGEEFAYRSRMDIRIRQQQLEADPVEQILSYDVVTKFTVRGVEEDGSATVMVRVIRATIGIADGDDRVQYDFAALADGEQYPTPFAAALAETVVTMLISPSGQITGILGAEAYEAALNATEDADPRLLGFFTTEQFQDMFEPLFTIEELNGKPRLVGTGWSTTREVELPPVAILDLSYNWRFGGVLDGIATLNSSIDTTVRRPSTPDPARPTVVLEDSSGNVLTQWDMELKAVTRRISTLAMKTQWALGDLQVNLEQSSVVRIERVPLED